MNYLKKDKNKRKIIRRKNKQYLIKNNIGRKYYYSICCIIVCFCLSILSIIIGLQNKNIELSDWNDIGLICFTFILMGCLLIVFWWQKLYLLLKEFDRDIKYDGEKIIFVNTFHTYDHLLELYETKEYDEMTILYKDINYVSYYKNIEKFIFHMNNKEETIIFNIYNEDLKEILSVYNINLKIFN